MTDKLRAAAKAALEWLNDKRLDTWQYMEDSQFYADRDKQVKALEAALAEPEQEPVGYEHHEYRPYGAPGEIRIHAVLKSQYLHPDGSIGGDFQYLIDSYKTEKTTIKLIPLYTDPPRREWVGLTDEDKMEIKKLVTYDQFETAGEYANRVQAATEFKIKEKNGG